MLSALSSGHYVATLLARSKGPPSNPRGLGVGGALGPGHKALSPGESRCACWGLLQGFGTYLLVVDVMEVRRAACEDCCWALAWIGDLKTHHRPGLPLHPGETRALTPASPRRVQVKIRCCVQAFSRAHHSTGFHHEQDNLCQCTLFDALISVGGAVQPAVPPSHGVLGLAAAPTSRGDHSAESGYTETTCLEEHDLPAAHVMTKRQSLERKCANPQRGQRPWDDLGIPEVFAFWMAV